MLAIQILPQRAREKKRERNILAGTVGKGTRLIHLFGTLGGMIQHF